MGRGTCKSGAMGIMNLHTNVRSEDHSIFDLLLELPGHNIRENLKLSVTVRSKPGMRFHAVFIQDTEAAKLLMLSVVIPM